MVWGIIPASLFFVSTWFVMKGPKFLPKAFPPGTEIIISTALATLLSMYTDYPGGIGKLLFLILVFRVILMTSNKRKYVFIRFYRKLVRFLILIQTLESKLVQLKFLFLCLTSRNYFKLT